MPSRARPTDPPLFNALGLHLRTRLAQRHSSLAELARQTGLSRQTLHAAGSARSSRLPDLDTIIRLAVALGEHPIHLIHLVLEGYQLPSRSVRLHAARGDYSAFVDDVTIPDGTVVAPGARFTKTWALQNVGTVPWLGRSLRCMDEPAPPRPRTPRGGTAAAGSSPAAGTRTSPRTQLQPLSRVVDIPPTAPGAVVQLSVDMVAPRVPCTCVSYWKMALPDGSLCFPDAEGLSCTVRVLSMRAAPRQTGA